MKANRLFVVGFLLAAMCLLWTACSGTQFQGCEPGTEGCACATDGGPCAAGLTCISLRCVDLDAGPTGSSGSTMSTVSTSTGNTSTVSTGSSGAGGGDGGRGGMGGRPGTTGGGGAGGSGGSGVGGMGGGPPGTQTLGASCKSDPECVPGLICVKPTDRLGTSTGGVANGLCTRDCSIDTTVCPANATCITLDVTAANQPKAYCVEKCAIGNFTKCHGRLDTACGPLDAANTMFACLPLCASDADCAGRRCDLFTGLCVDTPMAGKPIGAACTVIPGQSNTDCAGGACLPIAAVDAGPTPGVCSGICRYGTQASCGFRTTPLAAGPPAGSCAIPYGDGFSTGDLGVCLQLCDTPNDCLYHAPNWTCRTDIMVGGGHAVCGPTP